MQMLFTTRKNTRPNVSRSLIQRSTLPDTKTQKKTVAMHISPARFTSSCGCGK